MRQAISTYCSLVGATGVARVLSDEEIFSRSIRDSGEEFEKGD